MKNVLIIDTSDKDTVKITLEINGKKETVVSSSKSLKSQTSLMLIDKILKNNNISAGDISEIRVNRGPGSFTGIRIGISIANALSFLLKIPVNSKKIGEIEAPVYN